MEASELHDVEVGSERIEFSLVRRVRKTLAVNVHPDATVEVIAPAETSLAAVKKSLKAKLLWVNRQRSYFNQFLPALPPKQCVGGETHYYLGKQYRLKVHVAFQEAVKLKAGYLHVYTRDKANRSRIGTLVDDWYREKAESRFHQEVGKLLPKLSRYGVQQPILQLRKMQKRWGSCSANGRILLNPEVIKAPPQCIEYVVMHELCHLVVPSHSRKYYRLLERVMPDWERRKERLETSCK
jgi:predicted metal-dependent hydrolase